LLCIAERICTPAHATCDGLKLLKFAGLTDATTKKMHGLPNVPSDSGIRASGIQCPSFSSSATDQHLAEIEKLLEYVHTLEQEKDNLEMELAVLLRGVHGPSDLLALCGHRILLIGCRATPEFLLVCAKYQIELLTSDASLSMSDESSSEHLMDFDVVLLRKHFVDHEYERQIQRWCLQYGVRFEFFRASSMASFVSALKAVSQKYRAASCAPRTQCLRHA